MDTFRDRQAVSPHDTATNERLRSEFVRKLILQSTGNSVAGTENPPPRLLVQFWDDATSVPGDVQACLDSWGPLERFGIRRVLFNDVTALRFIENNFSERHVLAFSTCAHPAMRADYFRLCFMLRRGGLYVDADDVYLGQPVDEVLGDGRLKLQALCYDIPTNSMLQPFETAEHGEDASRIFYVNNNPLIAPRNHPILARALRRATDQLLSLGLKGTDIQSMTGPGNLTASLVEHALGLREQGADSDFALLTDWDAIATSKWPLDYRSDNRNWRNWARGNA